MKGFGIKQAGSTVPREFLAGITTFFTMAYIIFVNPMILGAAGMPEGGVFVATILASIAGTLVMGLVANVPYAVAPGMGLNAFFTYTVCQILGFSWQEALAMVFICGLINILITVTKLRKVIVKSIPVSVQSAIGGSIGLFIMYIGIKNAGWLSFTADPGTYEVFGETVVTNSQAIPALVNFTAAPAQLALIGFALTLILMIIEHKTKKSFGAILIGIVLTTLIGIPMGVTDMSLFTSGQPIIDMSHFTEFRTTFLAFLQSAPGETPAFITLFSDASRLPSVLLTIFAFSLTDTFDTIGTFIGTGRRSGIFDEEDEKSLESGKGFKSRMDKALFADSTATSIGALFGTSNATTYVESAAGIGVGGRTGLTSVTVAALFALCLPFASLFGIVPGEATAPALILVGVLMASSFKDIDWSDLSDAAPALLTAGVMAFAYSISYGIAAGFITFIITRVFTKRAKEVHWIIYVAAALFILNFILNSII